MFNSSMNDTHNATASSLTTEGKPALQGTAVIQLMGELGNHLSILAHYFAVRTIAATEFNLELKLHVRKQKANKATPTSKNVQCMKSFRYLDFDECSWSHITDTRNNNGTMTSISKGQFCTEKINKQMAVLYEISKSQDGWSIDIRQYTLNITRLHDDSKG